MTLLIVALSLAYAYGIWTTARRASYFKNSRRSTYADIYKGEDIAAGFCFGAVWPIYWTVRHYKARTGQHSFMLPPRKERTK